MKYTFNIYTAKEFGDDTLPYWVVCEETSYLIGAHTKKLAKALKRYPENWTHSDEMNKGLDCNCCKCRNS